MTSAARPPLRIGTRGSPLALAQTERVKAALRAAHPALAPEGALETVVIRTTGDRVRDRPLAEIGGKGLFAKEIEEALLDGRIELAVHSMKDMPTRLPPALAIAAMLPREDPRDVLLARAPSRLADLPAGAVVGTASPRRAAQVLARRPDLRAVNFRGNVGTRLAKLAAGEVDATLLALAGLRRLGLDDLRFEGAAGVVVEPEEMLPAVGQGAIGIECRAGDGPVRALLAPIDHAPTTACVGTERALLDALDGSCRTPIAGLAEIHGGEILLRAWTARPDGSGSLGTTRRGPVADGPRLGRDAGEELRRRAGPGFFDV
ncbi:MAG TPA: hydroxymethylbilane synthase [Geminicoccaceae bacterium]|nr:hydroxymethylbilane synthase [Geminicoccaceae bacterium]